MKLPWFKFNPKDWLGEPCLRMVSLQTKAVWIDFLCLMWNSPRKGYLLAPNGNPFTPEELCRLTATSPETLSQCVQELKSSETCSLDSSGVIYSRRMVNDVRQAEKNNARVTKHRSNGHVTPDVMIPVMEMKQGEVRSKNTEDRDKSKALVRSVKPDSNPPPPEFSASNGKPASKRRIYLADAEFVIALKLNPAYAGIDVDLQIHKARAWLMTPRAKGKQLTRQFLVNWLNRCDSVIGVVQPQKKEKVMTQEEKDKYFKLNELIKSFPQSIPEIKQLTGADFGFVFGGLSVEQKNELNGLKKEKV